MNNNNNNTSKKNDAFTAMDDENNSTDNLKRKDWERLLRETIGKKEDLINVRRTCYAKLAYLKEKYDPKSTTLPNTLTEDSFNALVADLEATVKSLDPVEHGLDGLIVTLRVSIALLDVEVTLSNQHISKDKKGHDEDDEGASGLSGGVGGKAI